MRTAFELGVKNRELHCQNERNDDRYGRESTVEGEDFDRHPMDERVDFKDVLSRDEGVERVGEF